MTPDEESARWLAALGSSGARREVRDHPDANGYLEDPGTATRRT